MAETVYLLAAGVNQAIVDWDGLRPPLARSFFQTALASRKFTEQHYLDRVADLYSYIERYWKKNRDQLAILPFDIEELFTLLELQRSDAEEGRVTDEVARLVGIEFRLKSFLAEVLSEFEYRIVMSDVMRALGQVLHREKPTIITFNYDCFIEEAIESASGVRGDLPAAFLSADPDSREVSDEELAYSHFNWNRPLAYGLEFDEVQLHRAGISTYVGGDRFYRHPQNGLLDPPMLKLHGSLNWFRYLPVRKYPRYGDRNVLPEDKLRQVVLIRGHRWFNEPPDINGWLLDPLLITPVLNKQPLLRQAVFAGLWQRARAELSCCSRLVVIGYSFAPTDFNTKRLFLEAFSSARLRQLVVVNPDTSMVQVVKDLTHFDRPVLVCRDVAEYLTLYA